MTTSILKKTYFRNELATNSVKYAAPALAVHCTSSYRIELSLLAFGESAPLDVVLPLLCLVQLKHRRHARVYFLMGEGRDLGNDVIKKCDLHFIS